MKEYDYTKWNVQQWEEWLTLRDKMVMSYFDLLKKYIHLPARERLIQKELRKIVDPEVMDLVYSAAVPPGGNIMHSWLQPQPYSDEEMDHFLDEQNRVADSAVHRLPQEEFPRTCLDDETLATLPDDARLYDLLAEVEALIKEVNRFIEKWISFMGRALPAEYGTAVISVLGLLAQMLSHLEGCRDALLAWSKPQAEALMKHAERIAIISRKLIDDYINALNVPLKLLCGLAHLTLQMKTLWENVQKLPDQPEDSF
ncbi:MAG: hypothetical protein IJJ33_20345 [Victivallales bacterium]|nr:hypothetical protein [Victivallales bacterium]